ncbi:tryptophan-rich antigen [Plasmodium brasilianum]|uniref:Tryptophan-rich antigen n=1 Tax=Plasmodium brasilianum TaxID=5824 RepID=A0ACB9YDD8_PLABR|nr:tryptophan-rich antigen [Plasmodium brasilianum]
MKLLKFNINEKQNRDVKKLIHKLSYLSLNESNHYPSNVLEYLKDPKERSHEWKVNRWKNWMNQLEEDWEEFSETLQTDNNEWIEGNEEKWEIWFESIKKKWIHYNKNLENEYKKDILAESLTWDETMWKVWINTEGREHMEKEWKTWIAEKESNMYDWVVKQWSQWKSEKIEEWVNSKWKLKEDEYWKKWEHKVKKWNKMKKMLHSKENNDWMKWKQRVEMEREQWLDWVESKDEIFINQKWKNWKKWKNNKRNIFYKWVDNYINKWIDEKKWVPLVNEVKELTKKKGR